jgi:hypothetical protein
MTDAKNQPAPDRLTIELRKTEQIAAFTALHMRLKIDLGLDLTNTQILMWLMSNVKE